MAFDFSNFIARVQREELCVHGIALSQGGTLLGAHRFDPDVPHVLHSLSKSYLACGIGMLVDQGKLSLEDKVVSFFPELLPDVVSDELAALSVYHLLIMSSGRDEPIMMSHQRNLIADNNWVRYFLSLPMDRMPGEKFLYDSACTYILSAILTAVTGETALDYLMPRLFVPLGITQRPQWDTCPRGLTLGCAGLELRTEQLLPLGQLMLEGGVYNGHRLLSEGFVSQALTKHIDSYLAFGPDWTSGYGFQFWRCANGCVRGSGSQGQYCIISQQKQAVIAVNATESRQQALLDAVWDEVYAAL